MSFVGWVDQFEFSACFPLILRTLPSNLNYADFNFNLNSKFFENNDFLMKVAKLVSGYGNWTRLVVEVVAAQLRREGRVTKEGWLDREAYAFFFLFFFSLCSSLVVLWVWDSYSLIGQVYAPSCSSMEAAAGEPATATVVASPASSPQTMTFDTSTTLTAQQAASSLSSFHPDYMGLALKQWSVYLGNVLLNFIHKECKSPANGHCQYQSMKQRTSSNSSSNCASHHHYYCNNHCVATCTLPYQHHSYYCNYANFLNNGTNNDHFNNKVKYLKLT